jgi:hypothetical protein
MPVCPICDDTGLQNSDSTNPQFCYCSAGKKARRQWEINQAAEKQGKMAPKAPSFIDLTQLEQVNASVDAMRASLLGSAQAETPTPTRHPAVQLLFQVAHPGHEISVTEATNLHDLAKQLEIFLNGITFIGRNIKR